MSSLRVRFSVGSGRVWCGCESGQAVQVFHREPLRPRLSSDGAASCLTTRTCRPSSSFCGDRSVSISGPAP